MQRFSATGTSVVTELVLTDLKQPALALGSDRVIMVGVRPSDGYVVSWTRDSAGAWAGQAQVEIGAAGGGNHSWPNPVPTLDGRLRLAVRGPSGATDKSTVYWYQRTL